MIGPLVYMLTHAFNRTLVNKILISIYRILKVGLGIECDAGGEVRADPLQAGREPVLEAAE